MGGRDLLRGQGTYQPLINQLCCARPRLLFIAEGRKEEALSGIQRAQGEAWCAGIRHVCSDMWRAYLKSVGRLLPNAMHILDRFHIEAKLIEAVDKVRRAEARELAGRGLVILKNLRCAFLMRPENLTDRQREGLQQMVNRRNLKTVRADHWKESLRLFWEYECPYAACKFLRRWRRGADSSRLEPIKSFVKTLRRHEELILNWFRAKKRFSSGAVEAMNRGAGLVSNLAGGLGSRTSGESPCSMRWATSLCRPSTPSDSTEEPPIRSFIHCQRCAWTHARGACGAGT